METTGLWIYIWEHFCCCIVSARSPCCTKTVLSIQCHTGRSCLNARNIAPMAFHTLLLAGDAWMREPTQGWIQGLHRAQSAGSHDWYIGKYWSNSRIIGTMSHRTIKADHTDIYWPHRLTAHPKAYPKLTLQMAKLAACPLPELDHDRSVNKIEGTLHYSFGFLAQTTRIDTPLSIIYPSLDN